MVQTFGNSLIYTLILGINFQNQKKNWMNDAVNIDAILLMTNIISACFATFLKGQRKKILFSLLLYPMAIMNRDAVPPFDDIL